MSFGLLDLKNSKNQSKQYSQKSIQRKKVVVVGSDFGSYVTGLLYQREYGEQDFSFLTSKQIESSEFMKMFREYLLFVRGEEQAQQFKDLFPGVELQELEEAPLFYKDQTFKAFDGRAKPLPLGEFESFFIQKPFEFAMDSFFESDNLEIEDLNVDHFIIAEVTREDNLWVLRGTDGSVIETETLLWGESRKAFYDVAKDYVLKSCNEKEVESLLCFRQVPVLQVYWNLNNVIREKGQTLFIPQSHTHDWGHFIVDFSKPNLSTGEQVARVLCTIADDDISEEFLGKKLKLIRRNLGRVFPQLLKSIESESVFYYDNFLCALRDVSIEEDALFDNSKLPSFIGPQASRDKKTFSNCDFPFMMNMLTSYNDHRKKMTRIQ